MRAILLLVALALATFAPGATTASHVNAGCHGTVHVDHLYACPTIPLPGLTSIGVQSMTLYVRVSGYDCVPPTGHPFGACRFVLYQETNGVRDLQTSTVAWGGTAYPPDTKLIP